MTPEEEAARLRAWALAGRRRAQEMGPDWPDFDQVVQLADELEQDARILDGCGSDAPEETAS